MSHGAIEVYGTRFIVIQRKTNGSVSLQEGSIAFQSTDGQTLKLRPGDRFL